MQAALIALKTAGALISGGAPTAGGLGALSATLGTAGTIYSTVSGMRQARLAEQTARANAERASFTGQVSAQDADIAAAEAIAAAQEARAFSGFAATSETFRRADRRNRILARRDSTRIRNDADLEAEQYRAQAEAAKKERSNLALSGFFDTLGGITDMRTALIPEASLTKTRPGSERF